MKSESFEATQARLKIAMDALHDIETMPNCGRAAKLASAVLRLIESAKPIQTEQLTPPTETERFTLP